MWVLCAGYNDGYERFEYTPYDMSIFEHEEDAMEAVHLLIENGIVAPDDDHYCFYYEDRTYASIDAWLNEVDKNGKIRATRG